MGLAALTAGVVTNEIVAAPAIACTRVPENSTVISDTRGRVCGEGAVCRALSAFRRLIKASEVTKRTSKRA